MRGGSDHLHALAKEGAEARPRLHHRIPIGGLLVSAPVDAAEIVGAREMRGSGEVGQDQHGYRQPTPVVEQMVERVEMIVGNLPLLAKDRTGLESGKRVRRRDKIRGRV